MNMTSYWEAIVALFKFLTSVELGVFLTIVGLLGFGGGFGMMGLGGFGHGYRMMGGWGCGYSPFFSGFNILFSLVGLVFLGVALFGLYLIYDAVRK